MDDAPDQIHLSLEEALDLLSALEDARSLLLGLIGGVPLQVEDAVGPLVVVHYQMAVIRSRLGIGGDPDDR